MFLGWQGIATFLGIAAVVVLALYVFVKAMDKH